MVAISGFQALLFDADKTGALDHVLTPPYDVIDGQERARLAGSCPFNMTHLTLPVSGKGLSPYAHAAALLAEWQDCGALKKDKEPSIYLLRQQFTDNTGTVNERKAFFALIKLPEAGEKNILGHERTFDKPVEDRLALIRAVDANLEPIFVMYADPRLKVGEGLFQPLDCEPPLLSARTSDGVLQEVWRTECSEALKRHLERQTLYIADGHHRFKTACVYRDERRFAEGAPGFTGKPYEYIMAGFVAFEDPGLRIFAAHRVVPAGDACGVEEALPCLEPYFDCKRLSGETVPEQALLTASGGCCFVMHGGVNNSWLLTLKEEKRAELVGTDRHPAWCDLDVAVLHRGILNLLLGVPDTVALTYEKNPATAVALVDQGKASLAFLLRPTRSDQVRACAEAFEPMPQKSTYYFPKLPSGAALYSLA